MTQEQIERIKRQLQSNHYCMNDTWLRDCLNYYYSENDNATDEQTLTFVTSQWLLSDLREINNENGCLPRNLAGQKSTTLHDRYILQVDKGYDIATSKYKQLESIRQVSTENIEVTDAEKTQAPEVKSKRMMQLFLTDGMQDVLAIEYRPIKSLKDIILPGFKIMIKGPVVCRKGVILLEETNIKEIGGEVESLLIQNATENVFARALNLPENPDPYNDDNEKAEDPAALFEDDLDVDFDEINQLENQIHRVGENSSRSQTSSTRQTSKLSNSNQSCGTNRLKGQNSMISVGRQMTAHNLPVSFQNNEILEDDDFLFEEISESSLDGTEDGRVAKSPVNAVPSATADHDNHSDAIFISDEEKDVTALSTSKKNEVETDGFGDIDENMFVLTQQAIEELVLKAETKKQETTKSVSPKLPAIIGAVQDVPKSPEQMNTFTDRSFASGSTSPAEPTSNAKERTTSPSTSMKRSADPLSPPSSTSSKMICNQKTPRDKRNGRAIVDYFEKNNQPQSSSPIQRCSSPPPCDFICKLKKLSLTSEKARKKVWGKVKSLGSLQRKDFGWYLEGVITDGTDSLEIVFASELLSREFGFTVEEFSLKKKLKKKYPEIENELRTAFRNANKKLENLDALLECEFSMNEKPKVISFTELTDSDRRKIAECMKQLGD